MKLKFENLRDWWESKFLRNEFLLSCLLTLLFAIWCIFDKGSSKLDALLLNKHATVWVTLISLFGTLVGFSITAVAIIVGFSERKVFAPLVSSQHYETMWKAIKSTIRSLGSVTLISVIGLIIDSNEHPKTWFEAIAFGFICFASFRLVRFIWILEQFINLVVKESRADSASGSEIML